MTNPETARGPLRVTQVVCSERFYGVERYVTTLANGLAERGCRVRVIGGPAARMSSELHTPVDAWHPAGGTLQAFTQLLRGGQVDVIHAHMTHAELAATLARRITNGRVVVTRHFAERRGSTAPGRLASQVIRRGIDLQLACSNNIAARIDGPSRVVFPGVPKANFIPPAERTPIVLVLQRLEPAKDTETALRAWASSGLHRGSWRLHIAGDGAERKQLEWLASRLGISESCRFLGDRDDVSEHLRRASILLAPAPDEPFGLSVVEAMAVGLPVVATASAGHLESVGLCRDPVLFRPGDAHGAGRLLGDLAGDPERRAAYGKRLQELQRERFSTSRQVEETLGHYRRLRQGPRSPAAEHV